MVLSPLRNRGSAIKNGLTHHAQSPSKYALFSYDSKRRSATAVFPTHREPVMIINFCFNFSDIFISLKRTKYKDYPYSWLYQKPADKAISAFSTGFNKNGGERGIRTLGTVSRTHAFQACTFNHLVISPRLKTLNYFQFASTIRTRSQHNCK